MGLFDNHTWRLPFPAPFDDETVYPKYSTSLLSKHNTATGTNAKSTLHGPILRALIQMARLELNDEDGTTTPEDGAVGQQTDAVTIVEYPGSSGSIQAVVFTVNNGKFKAAEFADPGATPSVYSIKERGGHTGAALFFALIPTAKSDNEFADYFERFKGHVKDGFRDTSESGECAYILCDNLYRRVQNAANLGAMGISVSDVPASDNVPSLTPLQINRGTYRPTNVMYGTFQVLTQTGGGEDQKPAEHKDFVGKYAFSSVVHTRERLDMVKELDKDFIISHHAVTICEHAKGTGASKKPMRNFALRGESGVGKTEIAKAASAGMVMPYDFFLCGPNTDESTLLGGFVPMDARAAATRWPSLEDIQMDPGTAYQMLTGKYVEDITADQVFKTLLEVVQSQSNGGPAFQFIESPLVQAMRYGTLVEVQEPAVILQPGVMSKLNSLLDKTASVKLDNGESVQRHPDSVMIVTTNVDYEGCVPINQSVLSRMDLIIDVDLPPVELMVKIVCGETGFTDTGLAKRMAQAIHDINRKRQSAMIKDGCSGLRELINWVQSYQLKGDVLGSAQTTVLATVSSKAEYRKEIEDTCIATLFAA